MKRITHRLALDSHDKAICHRLRRHHPDWLTRKTTLSEEITRIQYSYRSFLANLRHDSELDLPRSNVKQGVAPTPLSKDNVLLG